MTDLCPGLIANLVLAANANCAATMPDVTGTNFIRATDLSGIASITQNPTNGTALLLGTNAVVLAVAAADGLIVDNDRVRRGARESLHQAQIGRRNAPPLRSTPIGAVDVQNDFRTCEAWNPR